MEQLNIESFETECDNEYRNLDNNKRMVERFLDATTASLESDAYLDETSIRIIRLNMESMCRRDGLPIDVIELPSLESYTTIEQKIHYTKKLKVSLEGIFSKIGDAIAKFFKWVLDKISSFFSWLFGKSTSIENKVEQKQEEVAKIKKAAPNAPAVIVPEDKQTGDKVLHQVNNAIDSMAATMNDEEYKPSSNLNNLSFTNPSSVNTTKKKIMEASSQTVSYVEKVSKDTRDLLDKLKKQNQSSNSSSISSSSSNSFSSSPYKPPFGPFEPDDVWKYKEKKAGHAIRGENETYASFMDRSKRFEENKKAEEEENKRKEEEFAKVKLENRANKYFFNCSMKISAYELMLKFLVDDTKALADHTKRIEKLIKDLKDVLEYAKKQVGEGDKVITDVMNVISLEVSKYLNFQLKLCSSYYKIKETEIKFHTNIGYVDHSDGNLYHLDGTKVTGKLYQGRKLSSVELKRINPDGVLPISNPKRGEYSRYEYCFLVENIKDAGAININVDDDTKRGIEIKSTLQRDEIDKDMKRIADSLNRVDEPYSDNRFHKVDLMTGNHYD